MGRRKTLNRIVRMCRMDRIKPKAFYPEYPAHPGYPV
jgi:hypothetical protein